MKRIITLSILGLILLISACGNNKNVTIQGVEGPYVILDGNSLVMTTIFDDVEINESATYQIPKFDEAFIEVTKTDDNKTALSFRFNIIELTEFDDGELEVINLPDKRDIPGITNGSLPGMDFAVDGFEYTSLYLSANHLGVFIPYTIFEEFSSMASFNYYINNNSAGYITIVGSEEEHHVPGIILLLDFNQNVKNDLLAYLAQ